METIELTCTDTDKKVPAEVLQKTNRRLVVVVSGTTARLVLSREDLRKPYIGSFRGLELVYKA